MTGTGVVVTDGEERSALAIVRSLGRSGYRVTVCSPHARPLAGASRRAARSAWVPDPLSEPDAYAEAVAEVCSRAPTQVLLPVTEASLRAILPRREGFEGVSIPFPSIETFAAISDKRGVLEQAGELGMAAPEQRVLQSRADTRALEYGSLAFPVVVKPSRSVIDLDDGVRRKTATRYASDRVALQALLAELEQGSYPVLLQQRVEGPGIGIFLLVWEGEVLARFAHRRIREKPPSGGVSVYRESVAADPKLVELSTRLLREFGWQGVAMVEYKIDAETGTPYLMEVNGRFWGSLQLAIDAGVDFPKLLVDLALGRRPEPVEEYTTGVRSRWWWGDVDHLLARLRGAAPGDVKPGTAPGRVRALADFLLPWRPGDRSEVLRLGDPRPFAREGLQWVRAALSG